MTAAAFFAAAAVSVQAQDLRSAKDKDTKKYGYVIKGSKEWVIEPVFDKAKEFRDGAAIVGIGDKLGIINTKGEWLQPAVYDDIDNFKKNGLAKVTQKFDKKKYYGIIDYDCNLVLPVQYTDISIDHTNDIVAAEANMDLSLSGGYGLVRMWGVYAHDGTELFAPQFYSAPSFSNTGLAVAKRADTRLKGVISRTGDVIVDFNHFGIERRSQRYLGLTDNFMLNEYETNGSFTVLSAFQGYVLPYDTKNDNVRIATYHKLGIARRLYINSLVVYEPERSFNSGTCYTLGTDWGRNCDRFVRLEPELVDAGGLGAPAMAMPGSLVDEATGRMYTIVARLYEPDGRFVEQISDNGYIESVCSEGIIYVASTGERWLALSDPNAPLLSGYKMRLNAVREQKYGTVQQAFSFGSSEKSVFTSWNRHCEAQYEILKAENAGITATVPYSIANSGAARAAATVSRYPVFAHEYRQDRVWAVSIKKANEGMINAICEPYIKYHVLDEIPEVSYRYECEGRLFWGPRGDRFMRLEPLPVEEKIGKFKEPKDCPFIFDDFREGKYVYRVAVNLYEADGTFVRNVAVSDRISFMNEHYILLEDVGLMFVLRPDKALHPDSKVVFVPEQRLLGIVSELDKPIHSRPMPASGPGPVPGPRR